jgi:hypothetical protein
LAKKDLKGCWIEVQVGPVEKHGENLLSGNNIADYLDAKGRIDLLAFFKDHQQQLPNLKLVHSHSARDCTQSHGGKM